MPDGANREPAAAMSCSASAGVTMPRTSRTRGDARMVCTRSIDGSHALSAPSPSPDPTSSPAGGAPAAPPALFADLALLADALDLADLADLCNGHRRKEASTGKKLAKLQSHQERRS